MLRYDLDKLAWWDFEALIQTLLKERMGIGIEAWGGSKRDLGRDAYYPGSLKFPTDAVTAGPFVFQCKFVEGETPQAQIQPPHLSALCARSAGELQRGTGTRILPSTLSLRMWCLHPRTASK